MSGSTTLKELALAMGISKSAIHKRADRESWLVVPKTALGGKQHSYAIATLPDDARTAVEQHRAETHLAHLEPDLDHWITARRIALTLEQRSDSAVLGKLLCARAVETMTDTTAAFSLDALVAILARRYEVAPSIIHRWVDEAQGWLSRAATLAPVAPVITLDAGEERRFAVAFWRSQIIAPIIQHEKWSKPRAAAIKHVASVKHMHPDGKMKKITAATLYNWCDLYELHGGLEALKPKLREDKGEARVSISRAFDKACRLDTDAKAKLVEDMTLYIKSGWASGVSGWRDLQIMAERHLRELARAQGWHPPTDEALISRRFLEDHRGAAIVAIKTNDAKGYFDSHLPRVRRTAAFLRPMELVVGDVHPLDIAIDLGGRRVYPRLISWHDLATNRLHLTVIFLQKREGVRREHIALAFTAMVEAWGLPERLYLDNGAEYSWDAMMKSFVDLARLTGRVRAEFLDMGQDQELVAAGRESVTDHISNHEIHRARAYNAPAKPIEGLFSVLESTVFSMVPGWVGGDRMRKKTQNVGREPEPFPGGEADIFKAIDTALAYYHRKAQHGWLDGKCPLEMYARHIAEGWQRVDCHPKTLLLSFAETYTPVADRGTVTINSVVYYHDELTLFTGKKLPTKVARHDPRYAFCFDPKTSKLICAAEPDRAYDFRDPRGAEEQSRRARFLGRKVAQIGEDCVRLDLVAEMEKVRAEIEAPVAPVGATVEASAEFEAMRKALEEQQERRAKEGPAMLPGNGKKSAPNSLWSAFEEEDPLIKGLVFLDDPTPEDGDNNH